MKVKQNMIDPQLRLTGFFSRSFMRLDTEKSLRRASAMTRKMMKGKTSKRIHCEEKTITTRQGNELRLCIYSPLNQKENAVGLLWFHGGGYVLGVPEMDLEYYEKLTQAVNCVIVAPDYRLATEAPYPAALNDGYEALIWMKEHAPELGIQSNQLFIGGDSAGGGLTAAVSLYARDHAEVRVAFQMPLYPMIDDRMNTESMKNNDAPMWNEKSNTIAWKLYLGDRYGTDDVPKYAAPARETDARNLPPTYTFVGDIEPFYDETRIYIENLQRAGVQAKIDIYEKCFHAFDLVGRADVSKRATAKMIEEFVYASQHYYAEQVDET